MRTALLMTSDGTVLNDSQTLLMNPSPVDQSCGSPSLFNNQITVECYDQAEQTASGLWVPLEDSVALTAQGTVTINVWSSFFSTHQFTISGGNTIDIATTSFLGPFSGVIAKIIPTVSGIQFCNYINILIDRA